MHRSWRLENARIRNNSQKAAQSDRRKCKRDSAVGKRGKPRCVPIVLLRVLPVGVDQDIDVQKIHFLTSPISRDIVKFDQMRRPIHVIASELPTTAKRDKFEWMVRGVFVPGQ